MQETLQIRVLSVLSPLRVCLRMCVFNLVFSQLVGKGPSSLCDLYIRHACRNGYLYYDLCGALSQLVVLLKRQLLLVALSSPCFPLIQKSSTRGGSSFGAFAAFGGCSYVCRGKKSISESWSKNICVLLLGMVETNPNVCGLYFVDCRSVGPKPISKPF